MPAVKGKRTPKPLEGAATVRGAQPVEPVDVLTRRPEQAPASKPPRSRNWEAANPTVSYRLKDRGVHDQLKSIAQDEGVALDALHEEILKWWLELYRAKQIKLRKSSRATTVLGVDGFERMKAEG